MSKRRKILLCIVAAALIIGLATGAFTLGDIISGINGGNAVQTAQSADAPEETTLPEIRLDVSESIESEPASEQLQPEQQEDKQEPAISEAGHYSSKEDVALYIHTYGRLPDNFITKSEARELGWNGGSVEDYAPGCSIGGDRFGNYEGVLPKGRYAECDIDTLGRQSRGAKRLVFSEDGRIYYTEDHYETFELLYGEE